MKKAFGFVVFCFTAVLALMFGVVQSASAATLIHSYELDGNFQDTFGGPDLVPNGGSLDAKGYSFQPNQGLSLTNGLIDTSDYTIVINLNYEFVPLDEEGWIKVIDYEELSLDFGAYVYQGKWSFWTLDVIGGADPITAGADAQVVLTRDGATGITSGYLNGVLQWSETDGTGQAIASGNVLTFFEDDLETDQIEAQPGSVDCIAIHDGAMTAAEVASLAELPGCGAARVLACEGFGPPMDDFPVKAKKNRVFPLKMELYDEAGSVVLGSDLEAPPIVMVMFTPASGLPATDVSGEALFSGHGSEGNQFDFAGKAGKWQFNLKSGNYSAKGEYLVTVVSGDESDYIVSPACVTSFVIE